MPMHDTVRFLGASGDAGGRILTTRPLYRTRAVMPPDQVSDLVARAAAARPEAAAEALAALARLVALPDAERPDLVLLESTGAGRLPPCAIALPGRILVHARLDGPHPFDWSGALVSDAIKNYCDRLPRPDRGRPAPAPDLAGRPATVVVAARSRAIRGGLAGAAAGIAAPGGPVAARDGYSVVLAARLHHADAVIVDAGIGQPALARTVAMLRALRHTPRVIAVAATVDGDDVDDMIRIGIDAAVGRQAAEDEVPAAFAAIAHGGCHLSPSVMSALRGPSGLPMTEAPPDFTPRESEVLALIADGHTSRDVANRLKLSVRTVEAHRHNLRRKAGAPAASDLTRVAETLGTVREGPGGHNGR